MVLMRYLNFPKRTQDFFRQLGRQARLSKSTNDAYLAGYFRFSQTDMTLNHFKFGFVVFH